MTLTATPTSPASSWLERNQAHLTTELQRIKRLLEVHLASKNDEPAPELLPGGLNEADSNADSALTTLCRVFHLSDFERDVLLLCAGAELEGSFAALLGRINNDPNRTTASFGLALSVLHGAHWSALTPSASLRRWRLVELGAGSALTSSALRLDERILHYLTGINEPDGRLRSLLEPLYPTDELVPSHREIVERVITVWANTKGTLPLVQLNGSDRSSSRDIAAAIASAFQRQLHALNANYIPAQLGELETLTVILAREAMLSGLTLLIECFDLDGNDQAKLSGLRTLLERYQAPLLLASADRQRLPDRASLNLEISKPSTLEQRQLWQHALPEVPQGVLEHLVAQFNLAKQGIERAVHGARIETHTGEAGALEHAIWNATRSAARPRMDDLAQRLETKATWDDLVLPSSQKDILRDITAHVRHRLQVYETWGFAAKSARGLGISALFAGGSGTGKTMAAEVVGRELELDVYRIDLSTVVSKYIGETEKNLRRIFDAAEEGGTVLLFDEADAIFGKRSEVKDSHDRYANIEVAYLLQRMESYRGLAILTTNLKSSIDTAFLRRIRFITHFPFPDLEQRSEMWRRAFPTQTPTQNLRFEKLGQLTVAGGNIRNMALNAAFIAADAGEPVMMKHILHAAESEYAKLEKQLTASEIHTWLEEDRP